MSKLLKFKRSAAGRVAALRTAATEMARSDSPRVALVGAALIALSQAAGNSPDVRIDADETAFLERELTQVRSKLFEVKYAENRAMSLVPLATDIAPDADTYSVPVLDRVGKAAIISNGVTDIPRVDVKRDEILGKVMPLAVAYGFELMELRKAARLGLPLEMWKGRAAKAAIEDKIDEILTIGANGITGLVNNALVAVDTSSFTVWAIGDTSDALIAELMKPAAAVVALTKGRADMVPDTMLLAQTMFDIIAAKPVGNVSDKTVLKWFLENNPYIKSVVPWNRLNTANAAGNGPRAIVYKRSADILEGVVPLQFEQLPPQPQGLQLVNNCIARAGGVKVYQPTAISYLDHTG